MKRTSIDAHNSIIPAKSHYHKIVVDGLRKLKVGGTFAEVADSMGVGHDKIWRRMSELQKIGVIYDTGITRKLPSNRQGTVWQLMEIKHSFADKVIEDVKNGGARQSELF